MSRNRERFLLVVKRASYQRALTGLLEDGEYRKAAQTVREWNEWITEHKDLQELAEQVDKLEREHQ